jgi:hypothetical protein
MYLCTYVPTYLCTFLHTYQYYLHAFFGTIYIPMYSTCLPMYLGAYMPIMENSLLYLSLNYLHTSSNLITYQLTYVHTYVTTNLPTYLGTLVPTYLYYLCITNVPTNLNHLCAYFLTYLHTYLPYLSTYVAIFLWYYLRTYV